MKANILMIGCGDVGSAFLEHSNKYPTIHIQQIMVKDMSRPRSDTRRNYIGSGIAAAKSSDISVVLDVSSDVDQVAEILMEAIKSKKHVITTNTRLVALRGKELVEAAIQNNVCFRFEGAICPGLPLQKTLEERYVSDKISYIGGVVSGLPNFLLTENYDKGYSFESSLDFVSQRGYGSDREIALSGRESMYKVIILTYLAYGVWIKPQDVQVMSFTESCKNLDFEELRKANMIPKYIVSSAMTENGIQAEVVLTTLPPDKLTSQIKGTKNGIALVSDLSGTVFVSGQGFGRNCIMSAIMSDLIHIIR